MDHARIVVWPTETSQNVFKHNFRRFKMNFKKTLVAAALAAIAPMSANAAVDFRFDWAALDGALGVANVRPLSNVTDELKVTLESVVIFTDNDTSGAISAGDTFRDYLAIRIDQLFDNGNNNQENLNGYGTAREITAFATLTGTQLDAQNYSVNNGGVLNFVYDSGAFTPADFGDLSTFVDSNGGAALVAETGTTVPVSGGTNSLNVPDGNIDLTLRLLDLILNGDAEVNVNGGPLGSFVFGLSDNNNNRCTDSGGSAACFANVAQIIAINGGTGPAADELACHTRSDGSFTKVIPEPGILARVGIGLMGLAFGKRRSKQA